MNFRKSFLFQWYPGRYFFAAGGFCVALFVTGYFFTWPIFWAEAALVALATLALLDTLLLFWYQYKFSCIRILPSRFSNSDANEVVIKLYHSFPFTLACNLTEELPEEMQVRHNAKALRLAPRQKHELKYTLRPFERGAYSFGYTICLVQSPLGMAARRICGGQPAEVQVYPSFKQLRQLKLQGAASVQAETGHTRLRKTGHSMEFDHIKEYVIGDDIRGMNWKATARRSGLMMNHYTEERSQQVFAVIDKGRLMKMPFDNLSLLDYAINTTIMLSQVVLQRQDRIGLVTFSHQQPEYVPAARNSSQLHRIQESLYKLQTDFLESDFEKLYLLCRQKIKQRSLLLLFTNFESRSGLQRQLPFLKLLAQHHLLLVILFENTELAQRAQSPARHIEDAYVHTLAAKFVHDKSRMVHELQSQGISCLLTRPENLTVATINRYVEIKSRQIL